MPPLLSPITTLPPVTFYPGPSKVYPQVAMYLQDAFEQGVLSINHRSATFMDICRRAFEYTKTKLNIPADYSILFVSSATESWEIIAQSLINKQSFHIYNGAFGQKWLEYTRKIHPESNGHFFDANQQLSADELNVPATAELIAFTQNETSNGTQLTDEILARFTTKYRDKLIAVDATSSLGGIDLDLLTADIWFASVQKCFGLPAGLGIMICSPKALDKARQLGDNRYYNSLLFMQENIQKFQTHYTPNVLNIYLLMRVMEQAENIIHISKRIKNQASDWYAFFDNHLSIKPLITNPAVRSDTVIAIEGSKAQISTIKENMKQAGIILGNGYGAWKDTTFRIANFPAIDKQEIALLQQHLNT